MKLSGVATFVTVLALCSSLSGAWDATTADLEHPFFGATEHRELHEEIHYAHSWGYESPPPAALEGHVTYYPPKREGTVKHHRQLRAKMLAQTQRMLKESMPGSSRGRMLGAQYTAAGPTDAYMAAAPVQNFPAPPPAPPTAADNVTFDQVLAALNQSELEKILIASMQQPEYPVNATAEITNVTIQNTLQDFGLVPRYSSKFGIAMKDAQSGRWYTYVNSQVWYWGADDWSTKMWSCRYYQPGPSGFDCTYDRTCPGCDRCRGEHCYYNQNKRTYCKNADCTGKWGIVNNAKWCAQHPIWCGMSWRVGTKSDVGWPGIGEPN